MIELSPRRVYRSDPWPPQMAEIGKNGFALSDEERVKLRDSPYVWMGCTIEVFTIDPMNMA